MTTPGKLILVVTYEVSSGTYSREACDGDGAQVATLAGAYWGQPANTSTAINAASSSCIAGIACEQVSGVIVAAA